MARAAYALSQQGIQVVIATHSLFLLKELELLARDVQGVEAQQRYFALIKGPEGVQVEQGRRVDDLQTLVLLDEELAQSDRYLELA